MPTISIEEECTNIGKGATVVIWYDPKDEPPDLTLALTAEMSRSAFGGSTMSEFNRGISDKFIDQLREEAKKESWWADVINDPKLFVAVREESLNVYWHGQSLFRVKPGPKVTTHAKFLLDPELDDQVPLVEREFNIGELQERGFISQYTGTKTLTKMKKASGLFAGLEKTGCHEIGVNNPEVIDCEIAFGGNKKGAPRADIATLEQGNGGDAHLVFWEAKHYSNPELRAEDGRPIPVCDQVRRYKEYLFDIDHRKAVVTSYKRVAENLVAIRDMGMQRPLSSLITEVGMGKRLLTLDPETKVGLIIFGFDQAEKVHPGWKHHLERLKSEIKPVVDVGSAKGIRLKT
jgi:hypothetical protein